MRRSLDGDTYFNVTIQRCGAYLRPGAYQRKYDNLLNSSSRIQKFMGFKEKNYFLIVLSIQTLITVLSYDIFALRNH